MLATIAVLVRGGQELVVAPPCCVLVPRRTVADPGVKFRTILICSNAWGRLWRVFTTDEVEHALHQVGLRVTRPRVAVFQAVHEHPHAGTDSIIAAARQRLGAVSHQAVYDVLNALTVAGLLRRFQPMGTVARYEVYTGNNHHHAVCRSCGAIADIECTLGEAPCLHAKYDAGYEIEEAEVIYWGRCAQCAAPAPTGALSAE
jgi:Fe2+ or Zn2+ uptake regulation protein